MIQKLSNEYNLDQHNILLFLILICYHAYVTQTVTWLKKWQKWVKEACYILRYLFHILIIVFILKSYPFMHPSAEEKPQKILIPFNLTKGLKNRLGTKKKSCKLIKKFPHFFASPKYLKKSTYLAAILKLHSKKTIGNRYFLPAFLPKKQKLNRSFLILNVFRVALKILS